MTLKRQTIIFPPLLLIGFFSVAFFADAAVSFVACGTAVKVSNGNMIFVGIPAGIQNNDILVAYVHSRDNVNSAMQASWTNKVEGNGGLSNRLEVFWKRTSGSEFAPTIAHSGGGSSIARICAFRGVDTAGDPFNIAGFVQSNAGSPISTAAIITTVANTMILHVFGSSDNNMWGSLTGVPAMFAGQDANTWGLNNSSGLAYGMLAIVGSSGTAGAAQTALGPDAGASVQLALRSPDMTAPAAVSDLSASSPTASSMRLDWTAPGDDGITGTATSYDIRYSTAAITGANWASATQVSGEPAPAIAGSPQSMTVSGLNPNTLYYFAMTTSDEMPNTSSISNVPSGTTLPPPPPTVATNAASAITPTSATLNGSANPNGFAATGWFRYSATNPGSCNDSFGTRLPAAGGTALGSGSVSVAYSNSASPLTSGTTYYYCAIASNSGGTALGSVVSFFVPLPAAPSFTTPLTANPMSVVSGGPSTLTWASSGADSCSASANPANSQWDDVPAPPPLSGSQLITNLTVSTTFTITCTNLGGSTPSSATVTVTPPPNVSGHAWAGSGEGANDAEINANPGIGWIKMAGTASDGSPYGVLVSSASPGVLSGYGWVNPNDAVAGTNNIGWISFNAADVSGCPTAPCAPTLDRINGHLTGWARALGYQDAQAGGWDGWIRLWRDSDGDGIVNTDTGAAASDYGVLVSNCDWSGYAWGGGINIGWIHFGGALYPVTGSGNACAAVTPACSDGIDNDGDGLADLADPGCIDASDDDEGGPTAPSGLSADAGSSLAACNAIIASWTDNAADEDRFELERKLSSDPDTAYVEIAEPSAAVGSGTIQNFTDTGVVGGLLRDTSYTYRIRACNAFGCGAYSNTDSANNQNPLAQFTWTPPSPLKNANTNFNASASAAYGGTSITEYSWTFADGIPAVFCSSVSGSGCDNPPLTPLASSRFQLPPIPAQKSVTLRVTDSNVPARQCSATQAVTIRSGSTPPGWIEIPPE